MPPKMQLSKGNIGGGANPLADGARHSPPVSPLKDVAALPETVEQTVVHEVTGTVVVTEHIDPLAAVLAVPLPDAAGIHDGPLTAQENDNLRSCEDALDFLRKAFWAAGRALQIIRDGRLYRAHADSFDAYVQSQWGMQRSQADRLIKAWALAYLLQPIAPKVNEGQVRELLPVADRFGHDTAVTVYRTLADNDVKVTASILKEAVAILPAEAHDTAAVVERLSQWLRGDFTPQAPHTPLPNELFAALDSTLSRLTKKVRSTSGDPDAVRELARRLRSWADQVEQGQPVHQDA